MWWVSVMSRAGEDTRDWVRCSGEPFFPFNLYDLRSCELLRENSELYYSEVKSPMVRVFTSLCCTVLSVR